MQYEIMTADTLGEDMSEFVISTVPAGGLAPLGYRSSADTVMTTSGGRICTSPALKGLVNSDFFYTCICFSVIDKLKIPTRCMYFCLFGICGCFSSPQQHIMFWILLIKTGLDALSVCVTYLDLRVMRITPGYFRGYEWHDTNTRDNQWIQILKCRSEYIWILIYRQTIFIR